MYADQKGKDIGMRKIEFAAPASDWNEALPVGNGRLGAMIFGSSARERVQLNADSIWYGGVQERCNEHAREYLPEIRKLILEGSIQKAQELMTYALSGTPQSERVYQTAGDLWIGWADSGMTEYHRELDLEEGIVKVSYMQGGGLLTKEYFASYPAGVLAIRFRTTAPEGLNFTVMMTRGRYYDGTGSFGSDGIRLWGNTGENAVRFLTGVKAAAEGGECRVIGEHILVRHAREAVLYIAIETSFYEKGDLENAVKERLACALRDGYESVRDAHVKDYRSLYGRVDFTLGDPDGAESQDWEKYVADYFQFGRYLSISASRPGSLPANLQGIWNESMTPPWDSKYTININTEMNYWPVESCNLPECHLPLFDHLKRMRERGRAVAEKMYGCRGFVAHHNTDVWADCAPQDIYLPASYWVMGAAWLSTHIWKHYCYTFDREFLKEMYPVLQDAVLFFHDYLIEDGGYYITCPSVSPENTYILPSGESGCVCAGATMDIEILRDLFGAYLKASGVLGIENETTARTREIAAALPDYQIGRHGQITEWLADYEEQEPGHRHISQLYALHPSDQITPDKTPELAKAAAQTLKRRLHYGGGHTGWSCAWIVNMYARLWDGESAWSNLLKMFEKSTFPNRMSNHPAGAGFVFQIDGNYGAAAGISEMLLQSNEERTILLPAIPAAWKSGSVRGLVMHSGAEVDIKWQDGRLTKCTIRGKNEFHTTVCWENQKKEVFLRPGESEDLL